MRRAALLRAVRAAAWLLAASCATRADLGDPGERCYRTADCLEGLVCVENFCTRDIRDVVPGELGGPPAPEVPMDASADARDGAAGAYGGAGAAGGVGATGAGATVSTGGSVVQGDAAPAIGGSGAGGSAGSAPVPRDASTDAP